MALIWVLTGAKTGDNAQVLRAARAMGLPFTEKRIALKPEYETAKPKVEASLHILDDAKSDPLAAPWPDLVITIGRRLSIPALWIKAQSGGRTRIALFNAPKGKADAFDLIVAPSFYTIADGPKVCRIGLPLIPQAFWPDKLFDWDAFCAALGGVDLRYHRYPFELLFRGGYDAVPRARLGTRRGLLDAAVRALNAGGRALRGAASGGI